MRWRKRTERIIKRFALFPINSYISPWSFTREWRWLETVYISQTRGTITDWSDRGFVTKQEYENYISKNKKEKARKEKQ